MGFGEWIFLIDLTCLLQTTDTVRETIYLEMVAAGPHGSSKLMPACDPPAPPAPPAPPSSQVRANNWLTVRDKHQPQHLQIVSREDFSVLILFYLVRWHNGGQTEYFSFYFFVRNHLQVGRWYKYDPQSAQAPPAVIMKSCVCLPVVFISLAAIWDISGASKLHNDLHKVKYKGGEREQTLWE